MKDPDSFHARGHVGEHWSIVQGIVRHEGFAGLLVEVQLAVDGDTCHNYPPGLNVIII